MDYLTQTEDDMFGAPSPKVIYAGQNERQADAPQKYNIHQYTLNINTTQTPILRFKEWRDTSITTQSKMQQSSMK